MQVTWNLLVRGQWNLTDGVDRIPETAAAQVQVLRGARVLHVEQREDGAQVEAEIQGKPRIFRARAVIFATPGHGVPALCPGLPPDMRETLSRTQYSRIANVEWHSPSHQILLTLDTLSLRMLYRVRKSKWSTSARPNRCPEGAGMASVFLWNTPEKLRLDTDDESLKQQAADIVEQNFTECRGKVLFVHVIRWNIGIAQFPPGRLREMTALRKRLAGWSSPFDLCGITSMDFRARAR